MSLSDWFGKAFLDASINLQDELTPKPRPRLRVVGQAPSREEFAAWRDEPITQFVMGALSRNAEECREAWMIESWEHGKADDLTLHALRERSDALLGFTADYDAFCITLGLEPEVQDVGS
jgi:hypothetical protein